MPNLFKDCLGERFDRLAPLVRQAHVGRVRLTGEVSVEQGNKLAQWICKLFSMPPAKAQCCLVVHGHHDANSMTWNRYFDDYPMDSYFYKDGRYLVERLGPIHMKMALAVDDGVLTYTLTKTRLLGLPIPTLIAPRVVAVETQVDDQYRFSVNVSMPLVGTLISYSGDMQVETLVA